MKVERIGEATLYTADVLEALRSLADESVHCVMTSPPYWGLRDYGAAGQLGLEKTPEEYVTTMVLVFREVRRVLRVDGTCWINLGDSYASQGGPGWQGKNGQRADRRFTATRDTIAMREVGRASPPGLKPKDLVGIPWRVALALQSDGWYLRSDIIWAKPNPMPESVTDRPTKAHEYLFLLSKSGKYFYDAEAIKEPAEYRTDERPFGDAGGNRHGDEKSLYRPRQSVERGGFDGKTNAMPGREAFRAIVQTRNRRTVWTIATQPYPEAHFATFPEKLVEPCILAGCPEHACPKCGAPWVREVVDSPEYAEFKAAERERKGTGMRGGSGLETYGLTRGTGNKSVSRSTSVLGEHPTCTCGLPPIGGTFLDPFCGAGTALLVALRLARRAVGIELKPEYMALTRKRIESEAAQVKLCL